jgi:Mn2+/Fe2+ NRAMP family transporter
MKTVLAAIVIGAAALAVLGIVLILLPSAPASFGWFAYQPVGDFGFVGGASFVPASRLWGSGILAIAAVVGAFVAGWVLGTGQGRRQSRSGPVDHAPDDQP